MGFLTSMSQKETPKSAIFNLIFNIVIPSVILSKYSDSAHLGPVKGLIIAISFPIVYGSWDLLVLKKWNLFSLLGFASILLTGSLTLLQLDGFWFAVKEAAIPIIIGTVVFITAKSRYNLIRTIILNPEIFKIDLIESKIKENNQEEEFERLIIKTTYIFVLSFVFAAISNFVLATIILKSPAGTPEFNQELGKMVALTHTVIMVPSMIVLILSLIFLIRGLTKLTGHSYKDLLMS
jgi:hypothetical protein